MKIRDIIFEAGPQDDLMMPGGGAMPPVDPMGGGLPPANPMAAGMGAPPAPNPKPKTDNEDDEDLSDPKHSESKSKNFDAIISILEPLRQELLFHHHDPQYPVNKLLKKLNGMDKTSAFTYETVKSAVDSGALDNVVEKLSTDSITGENIIIFKKNETETPDGEGGGSTGGGSKPNAEKTVEKMAKKAVG